jgi:hypothetical protein
MRTITCCSGIVAAIGSALSFIDADYLSIDGVAGDRNGCHKSLVPATRRREQRAEIAHRGLVTPGLFHGFDSHYSIIVWVWIKVLVELRCHVTTRHEIGKTLAISDGHPLRA